MQNDVAIEYTIKAAAQWGGFSMPPSLVRNRENIVLKGLLRSGQHVAVRLHRIGYQTSEAIISELVWTKALAEAGFPCPRPIARENGDLIWQGDGPTVSIITWIDAQCVGEMGAVYGGIESEHCALYEKVGGLIADMHQTTDTLSLPVQPRPEWSKDGLLGETPWWGRFWENQCLTKEESTFLSSCRKACAVYLDGLRCADYGLIHADLLQENIMQNDAGLWVIDFDDAGYGYRLFDLGTALIQHSECTYLPALRSALINGYSAKQGVDVSDRDVQIFTLLRAFASAGWIMSRAAADDPRQRFYCNRALTLAREIDL